MRAQVSYDVKKLLFRRQFILGPRFADELSSWKRIEVGSNICLTVHPDLNAHQAVHNGKSITLLGYVLDPRNPQARDAEILDDLICALDTCDSLDGFFERTYPLGGRWILIVDDGEEIRLFNDPMGLRQVFYTDVSFCRDLWCASQPGIIAKVLNLEVDKAVVREFINSDAYETWDECFWPGDTSLYKEIIHLLPNHYLDLSTGSRHRYWPDRNLGSLAVEEGVDVRCETAA